MPKNALGGYWRAHSIKLSIVLVIVFEIWTVAYYLYYTSGDGAVHPGSRTDSAHLSAWSNFTTKLLRPREPNVLIYITTHLSDMHVQYLKACWPTLLSRSPLFRGAAFIMFVTEQVDAPVADMTIIQEVFARVGITVHIRANPGYHEGAVLAMAEGFANRWFDSYDWVVRVNPDVLIRNDSFLLERFEDETINGIFADCSDVPCPAGRHCTDRLVHTDFFAIRPHALPQAAFSAVAPSQRGGYGHLRVSVHYLKWNGQLGVPCWAPPWPVQDRGRYLARDPYT